MCILSKEFFEDEKTEAAKIAEKAVPDRVENNEEVLKHLNLSINLEHSKVLDQDKDRERII